MNRKWTYLVAMSIVACLVVVACDSAGVSEVGSPDGARSGNAAISSVATGGEQGGARSVGDVTIEVSQRLSGPGYPLPGTAALSARVYNDSEHRVDVTLRFIRDETIVHLAFLTVMPGAVTTVVSPEPADQVRLSGVDDRGRAIESADFTFGVDFDENTPVVYVVTFLPQQQQSEPEPEPVVPPAEAPPAEPEPQPEPQPEPAPEPYIEPTITLMEPAIDVTLTFGSTLKARWVDSSSRQGTVVIIGFRPAGSEDPEEFIQVAPAVSEALDGINDEVVFVVQGIEEGLYEVIARIDDGLTEATSVAGGRVQVVPSPDNEPPTLLILKPTSTVELYNGETLEVEWRDTDSDSSAMITLSIVSADLLGGGTAEYLLSPPWAEDPDGAMGDTATLVIVGALPGLYDLVGTIDDGELLGTARVEDAVRVLAEPENDVPQLTLYEPSEPIQVELGGVLQVGWSDSDENDNALISLFLDDDLAKASLDGDEFLLTGVISEDVDGEGDTLLLGIPPEVAEGTYRLAGTITDGISESTAFAPGTVTITSEASGEGGEDPPGTDFGVLQPAEDIFIRPGLPILVDVQHGFDDDLPVEFGFFLNGTSPAVVLRVALDPMTEGLPEEPDVGEILLDTTSLEIPNSFMPRSFVLEVEAAVGDQHYAATAPGLVWVFQEVEVLEAELIGLECADGEDSGGFTFTTAELVLTWHGGGPSPAAGGPAMVSFWLSADGQVPLDGVEDGTHKLVFQTVESVGDPRVDTVLLPDIHDLENGFYQLISVVQTAEFGQIVTPASLPELLSICAEQ